MDVFQKAFYAIDKDNTGVITIEDLRNYMQKMHFKEDFVTTWTTLFDPEHTGSITYEKYCQVLGLSHTRRPPRSPAPQLSSAITQTPDTESASVDAYAQPVEAGSKNRSRKSSEKTKNPHPEGNQKPEPMDVVVPQTSSEPVAASQPPLSRAEEGKKGPKKRGKKTSESAPTPPKEAPIQTQHSEFVSAEKTQPSVPGRKRGKKASESSPTDPKNGPKETPMETQQSETVSAEKVQPVATGKKRGKKASETAPTDSKSDSMETQQSEPVSAEKVGKKRGKEASESSHTEPKNVPSDTQQSETVSTVKAKPHASDKREKKTSESSPNNSKNGPAETPMETEQSGPVSDKKTHLVTSGKKRGKKASESAPTDSKNGSPEAPMETRQSELVTSGKKKGKKTSESTPTDPNDVPTETPIQMEKSDQVSAEKTQPLASGKRAKRGRNASEKTSVGPSKATPVSEGNPPVVDDIIKPETSQCNTASAPEEPKDHISPAAGKKNQKKEKQPEEKVPSHPVSVPKAEEKSEDIFDFLSASKDTPIETFDDEDMVEEKAQNTTAAEPKPAPVEAKNVSKPAEEVDDSGGDIFDFLASGKDTPIETFDDEDMKEEVAPSALQEAEKKDDKSKERQDEKNAGKKPSEKLVPEKKETDSEDIFDFLAASKENPVQTYDDEEMTETQPSKESKQNAQPKPDTVDAGGDIFDFLAATKEAPMETFDGDDMAAESAVPPQTTTEPKAAAKSKEKQNSGKDKRGHKASEKSETEGKKTDPAPADTGGIFDFLAPSKDKPIETFDDVDMIKGEAAKPSEAANPSDAPEKPAKSPDAGNKVPKQSVKASGKKQGRKESANLDMGSSKSDQDVDSAHLPPKESAPEKDAEKKREKKVSGKSKPAEEPGDVFDLLVASKEAPMEVFDDFVEVAAAKPLEGHKKQTGRKKGPLESEKTQKKGLEKRTSESSTHGSPASQRPTKSSPEQPQKTGTEEPAGSGRDKKASESSTTPQSSPPKESVTSANVVAKPVEEKPASQSDKKMSESPSKAESTSQPVHKTSPSKDQTEAVSRPDKMQKKGRDKKASESSAARTNESPSADSKAQKTTTPEPPAAKALSSSSDKSKQPKKEQEQTIVPAQSPSKCQTPSDGKKQASSKKPGTKQKEEVVVVPTQTAVLSGDERKSRKRPHSGETKSADSAAASSQVSKPKGGQESPKESKSAKNAPAKDANTSKKESVNGKRKTKDEGAKRGESKKGAKKPKSEGSEKPRRPQKRPPKDEEPGEGEKTKESSHKTKRPRVGHLECGRFPKAFATQVPHRVRQHRRDGAPVATHGLGTAPTGTQTKTSLKRRRSHKPSKTVRRWKVRESLRKPGTVLILLAGRHRGKRVVLLGRHKFSGLLIVTGPIKCNGVPVRRIHPDYVIATKTRVKLNNFKLPSRLQTREYFARQRPQKKSATESLFVDASESAKKTTYQLTEQRKADQKEIDKKVIAAIKRSRDPKLLFAYLRSQFSLSRSDKPHKMVF